MHCGHPWSSPERGNRVGWIVTTRTTRRRRSRIAAGLLVLFFAFGGIAEVGSAVLCIGEDGHTDVEYSLAGCCTSASASSFQTNSPVVLSDDAGCIDCVDLQFGRNSLKAGKKFLPRPELTVSRVVTPHGESGATRVSATTELIVHDVLVSAISSVVLLI